jgi:hypothetical protein
MKGRGSKSSRFALMEEEGSGEDEWFYSQCFCMWVFGFSLLSGGAASFPLNLVAYLSHSQETCLSRVMAIGPNSPNPCYWTLVWIRSDPVCSPKEHQGNGLYTLHSFLTGYSPILCDSEGQNPLSFQVYSVALKYLWTDKDIYVQNPTLFLFLPITTKCKSI